MRIIKSFILLTVALVITIIVAPKLPISPSYFEAVVIVIVLLFSHKFCSHKYWIVLPVTLMFSVVIPCCILLLIAFTANSEQAVTSALAQIWNSISVEQKFASILPVMAALVTLIYINQPHSEENQ